MRIDSYINITPKVTPDAAVSTPSVARGNQGCRRAALPTRKSWQKPDDLCSLILMPPKLKYTAGLVQMSCTESPDANLEKAVSLVEDAAHFCAEIVCLPELFRSQYFCQREDAALFDLAETVPGPTTETLGKVAKAFGYIPDLYRHLGAADLSIVTGGGTITLELTALERPFLYFPLREHAEQQFAVAPRCMRHNAGVRMDYAKTTPEQLAEAVVSNINQQMNYPILPAKGAQEAARLINQILSRKV